MKTIILNHKSYLSYDEIINYKKNLETLNLTNINLILLPNLAYLSLFKNSSLTIGSQNFYSYNFGSYTGEVSLEILKSMNIGYTLVGHPERLNHHLDSYQIIKDKFFRSISSSFKTILCVGHDENEKILKKELKFYLKGIETDSIKNLIIAFEPGSKIEGTSVNLKQINYVCNFIKSYMNEKYKTNVPFIYGGSVNKNNIKEILEITDGVILGKNSTNFNEIKDLIYYIDN